jgi:hypothetical protein
MPLVDSAAVLIAMGCTAEIIIICAERAAPPWPHRRSYKLGLPLYRASSSINRSPIMLLHMIPRTTPRTNSCFSTSLTMLLQEDGRDAFNPHRPSEGLSASAGHDALNPHRPSEGLSDSACVAGKHHPCTAGRGRCIELKHWSLTAASRAFDSGSTIGSRSCSATCATAIQPPRKAALVCT